MQTFAESKKIKNMIRFDETMEKIFKHCRRILTIPFVGPSELESVIMENILSDDAKPSPLIKYVNEICTDSNFRMKDRSLMDFDLKVF